MLDLEKSLSARDLQEWRRHFCTAYGGQPWTVVSERDQDYYGRGHFSTREERRRAGGREQNQQPASRNVSDVYDEATTHGPMKLGAEAQYIHGIDPLGFGRLASPHDLKSHAAELELLDNVLEAQIGAAIVIQSAFRRWLSHTSFRRLFSTTIWIQNAWRTANGTKGRLRHRGNRMHMLVRTVSARRREELRPNGPAVIRARLPSRLPSTLSSVSSLSEAGGGISATVSGNGGEKHMTVLKMMARQIQDLEANQRHTLEAIRSLHVLSIPRPAAPPPVQSQGSRQPSSAMEMISGAIMEGEEGKRGRLPSELFLKRFETLGADTMKRDSLGRF